MNMTRYPSRKRQTGQATIEYTVVVVLAVIVLIAQPNIIDDVVTALKEAYTAFVYAISWSDIPLRQ
jgi:Flp pilus assembly pilin Flp